MPSDERDTVQRWSTSEVPASDRLDYFAAALSEAITPMSLGQADAQGFHAELSSAFLGEIRVSKTKGAPHSAFRGRSELARDGARSFNLLMTLQAPWTADHRGSVRMLPRDVLVIDSDKAFKTDVRQAFVAVNVAVTEPWLRRWIPDPQMLAARRIPGDSAWGLTLSAYLGELTPELAAAPPMPLSVMADQVGSLLALMASSMTPSSLNSSPAVRELHVRIDECIAQRCTELELTATDVAASINVSVRTLHRALAAKGVTFGASLIDARANVAIRMLTSPSFRRVALAEIGRRAGFFSPSHFARVIRIRTGRTPRQLQKEGSADFRASSNAP